MTRPRSAVHVFSPRRFHWNPTVILGVKNSDVTLQFGDRVVSGLKMTWISYTVFYFFQASNMQVQTWESKGPNPANAIPPEIR